MIKIIILLIINSLNNKNLSSNFKINNNIVYKKNKKINCKKNYILYKTFFSKIYGLISIIILILLIIFNGLLFYNNKYEILNQIHKVGVENKLLSHILIILIAIIMSYLYIINNKKQLFLIKLSYLFIHVLLPLIGFLIFFNINYNNKNNKLDILIKNKYDTIKNKYDTINNHLYIIQDVNKHPKDKKREYEDETNELNIMNYYCKSLDKDHIIKKKNNNNEIEYNIKLIETINVNIFCEEAIILLRDIQNVDEKLKLEYFIGTILKKINQQKFKDTINYLKTYYRYHMQYINELESCNNPGKFIFHD